MSRFYLRFLALCYFVASLLYVLDMCDRRLQFSQMSLFSQTWTVYSFLTDAIAGFSLWKESRLGNLFFISVVVAQLAVFVAWSSYLRNPQFVVVFHAISLTVFLILLTYGGGEWSQQSESRVVLGSGSNRESLSGNSSS